MQLDEVRDYECEKQRVALAKSEKIALDQMSKRASSSPSLPLINRCCRANLRPPPRMQWRRLRKTDSWMTAAVVLTPLHFVYAQMPKNAPDITELLMLTVKLLN